MEKRVLVKLSGEALSGDRGFGYASESLLAIGAQLAQLKKETGYGIGIVIGGGNFWRGRSSLKGPEGNALMNRSKADQMGMLATVMNSICFSEILRNSFDMMTVVLTPFECGNMTKLYSIDRADKYFGKGMTVIFAGGTGHPYFSTDTGAVLRAVEIGAEELFLAKAIDGVYDADPNQVASARRYRTMSIGDIINGRLKVIDLTAAVLADENGLSMKVFNLNEEGQMLAAGRGEDFNGTLIRPSSMGMGLTYWD